MARAAAVTPLPTRKASFVASGRRIDLRRNGDGYRYKVKPADWQNDCFRFFDVIGEVKQATYLVANVISLVRLFIAHQPDPEQDPVPADPGMAGLAEAQDLLERLARGTHGGHAGLLRDTALNLKVPGEFYLVGWPAMAEMPPSPQNPMGKRAEPERWQVCSINELETKDGGRLVVHESRGDAGTPLPEPDENGEGGAVVVRVWLRHAEFSGLADSAMSGVLTECREIDAISQAAIATWNARTSAPLLVVSTDLDLDETTDVDGEVRETTFEERLMEVMTTPIQNPGDASSVVPAVLRGPPPSNGSLRDSVFTVDLARKIDERATERQGFLLRRVGNGLDVPVEEIQGLEDVKAWAMAHHIDQKTWNRYGDPTVRLILEGLTAGLLRPVLEEGGVAPEDAANLMIWFDPGAAIGEPDHSETDKEAFDRAAISWDAYRTRNNYTEEEAPTDEELDRRAELGLLRGSGGAPSLSDAMPPPPAPTASANGNGHRPVIVAARRRDPLGQRLMRIDRDLRTRLEEAANAAMRRALERAGNKIRNRAKATDATTASVRGVDALHVAERLGPGLVAALNLTDDELLAEAFDAYMASFDTRTARAQERVLRMLTDEFDLDDGEVADIAARQDQDRHEAAAWLSAALVSLAAQRLFEPEPTVALGESSIGALVPPGLLREAMARAGGSPGGVSRTGPPGGLALGDLVLDIFARHGQIIEGWEWIHGDPDRPFDGHEALDGVQFRDFADELLAVQATDDWLGVDFYRPGDHAGCQCDVAPVAIERSDAEPALAATVGARR